MPAVAVAWRLSVFPCSRYLVEGRQLGIGNVLHDRTPRLQEDQLALNAEGLKSCPLLDKSGQKWILAGDGLSAYDPKRAFGFPASRYLATVSFRSLCGEFRRKSFVAKRPPRGWKCPKVIGSCVST